MKDEKPGEACEDSGLTADYYSYPIGSALRWPGGLSMFHVRCTATFLPCRTWS